MAYSLPVAGGYRTSGFGTRTSPGGIGSTEHRGVDVGGRGTDWLVRSIGPGHVLAIGTNGVRGRWVAIRHDDGTTTAYQHLDEVTARGRVDGGTVLGVMGTTGRSTARHLHMEAFPPGRFVRVGDAWASTGRAIDPEPYLRARGVDLRTGTVTASNAQPGSGSLPDVDTTPVTPISPLEADMPVFVRCESAPEGAGAIFLLAPGEGPRHITGDEWALWVRCGAKLATVAPGVADNFLRVEVDMLASTLNTGTSYDAAVYEEIKATRAAVGAVSVELRAHVDELGRPVAG